MIGRGRTGAVYRVRHKITGTTRVLRTIPSNKYKDDTGLQQQISVMKAADHPNLAKLYGTDCIVASGLSGSPHFARGASRAR